MRRDNHIQVRLYQGELYSAKHSIQCGSENSLSLSTIEELTLTLAYFAYDVPYGGLQTLMSGWASKQDRVNKVSRNRRCYNCGLLCKSVPYLPRGVLLRCHSLCRVVVLMSTSRSPLANKKGANGNESQQSKAAMWGNSFIKSKNLTSRVRPSLRPRLPLRFPLPSGWTSAFRRSLGSQLACWVKYQ